MRNFILKYIGMRKCKVSIFFVISFLTTLFSIIMPYYNGLFIDAILEKPLLENVIYFAIVIGVLSIVAILINYIYGIVVIKIKLEMFGYLYLDIMQHLQKIPLLILNKYNPSYLNRRINDDITAVWEFFFSYFISFVIKCLGVFLLIFLIFTINTKILLCVVCIIFLYVVVYAGFKKELYICNMDNIEKSAQFYKISNEQLELITEIKALSLENESRNRIIKYFNELKNSVIKNGRVNLLFQASDSMITTTLNIIILILGGYELINNNLSLGEFVVLNAYFKMLFQNTKFFFGVFKEYEKAKSSYHRIKELLDIQVEQFDKLCIQKVETIDLKVNSFSYYDRKILEKMYINLRKDKIYLMKGKNGSGKSTVINILIGLLMEGMKGDVYYNNNSLTELDVTYLRKNNISLMLQKQKTIDGTIMEVVEFMSKMSYERFMNILKEKELYNLFWTESMKENQKFKNLSGGEKQRILLLCAIVDCKEIVILDEPSICLDKMGINNLAKFLEKIKTNHIILVTSHDMEEQLKELDVEIIDLENYV